MGPIKAFGVKKGPFLDYVLAMFFGNVKSYKIETQLRLNRKF